MSDIDNITSKLDTDKQKGVLSEKEFNDNFGKLNQEDYKKISEGLNDKNNQFLNILKGPIFETIQKKDLLNKPSLSVNELKIIKLFFISNSNIQERNHFKQGFKGYDFNVIQQGKNIIHPIGPVNANHPDIQRLNLENLRISQQIEAQNENTQKNIQQSILNVEKNETATRPLSQKLETLKNNNSMAALEELISTQNGILYDDNTKEITENEKQKIQKIIENVFSNPNTNSDQVLDYVWKFHCVLSDKKWSNDKGQKIEGSNLPIVINNQIGIKTEIMNSCYELAQAKCYSNLKISPENSKKNLLKLCNILTGRFNSTGKTRELQKDSEKIFNNPELTKNILQNLMTINGTIQKLAPVDLLKNNLQLKDKTCDALVQEVNETIPRPLSGQFGILDLAGYDKSIKISGLTPTLQARVIVLSEITKKIKADKQNIPFDEKYIKEITQLGINITKQQQNIFMKQQEQFKEESKKSDFWSKNGFTKSAQEYGLQGTDAEIFNLYRDINIDNFWAGQLSDDTEDKIEGYAKMGYMIGGTVMAMMIFPPAGVGYLGSAIAVGATSTILTQILYQKGNYNSFKEGVLDIGSQFIFDSATAFIGMKIFGPIIQKMPGFWNNVKNISQNLAINGFDFSVGTGAEASRQAMLGKNPDIMQMIRVGGVMATVFIMMGHGRHVKVPIDDMINHLKINDPKTNPSGFKKLGISEIEYKNSLDILEIKKNKIESSEGPIEKLDQTNKPEQETISESKKIKEDFNIEKQKFEAMSSDEILQYSKDNYDTIVEKYKEKMGNVVNVDDFRDYVGGRVGIDATKTHEAASYLADRFFEETLMANRGKFNNTVKFLSGGPGSGKSSIDDVSPNNNYAVVLDGTFKTYKNADKNIEKAISLGYNARVEFVFRDMNQSFVNGVLKRTIGQNKRTEALYGVKGLGRTLPLDFHFKAHNGSRETIVELHNKYGSEVIKFFGGGEIDMSIGNGIMNKTKTSNGTPPYVYQYDFNYVQSKIKNDIYDSDGSILAIEKAFQNHEITEKQKYELLGMPK